MSTHIGAYIPLWSRDQVEGNAGRQHVGSNHTGLDRSSRRSGRSLGLTWPHNHAHCDQSYNTALAITGIVTDAMPVTDVTLLISPASSQGRAEIVRQLLEP